MKKKFKNSGQVMIFGIIFMAVILILAASLFERTTNFIRFGSTSVLKEQAGSLADAGVDYTVWYLNKYAGANPSPTPQPVGSSGEFIVSVQNKTSALKTITATGYIPNATNPKAKRTVKVDALIDSDLISFHYAAQVGIGGVNMQNSSTINGTVYTNGSITGSGSSQINGEAWAVDTISSPDPTVTGTKHPGASPAPMPIEDTATFYREWKDATIDPNIGGETTTCPGGTCSYPSGTTPIGPQKLVGDLIVSNTGIVNVTGPIWVTGNVTVQNSAKIQLDPSFGSNGTVLITDGKVSTANSGAFVPTSASPKGYILVVTTNTSNDAIKIGNSGVNAVFYALDGGAELENTAKVTALVAKRLELENSASLTYDQGLASASFVSGPGAAWAIKKGTYRFTGNP